MLKPALEKYCLLVAEGWSQARAVREVNKTPQTATAWMKRPEVRERIAELRQDLTSQAIVLLRESVVENTNIILDIAKRGGERGIVPSRLKAAIWALEKVLKPTAGSGNESPETKALSSLARELEASSNEEVDELLERGAATD